MSKIYQSSFSLSFGLIILLTPLFVPDFLKAQELPLTHFTTDKEINPLPSAAITAVFQDQSDFIWMATYSTGLVRYDGTKMEHLEIENSGLGAYIFSITQDTKGRLWVGSAQNGLSASIRPLTDYLPGESIIFSKEIDGIQLHSQRIVGQSSVVADSFGNIWSGTIGNVLRYYYDKKDRLQLDTVHLPKSTANEKAVFNFLQRASGEISIMGTTRHLFHYNPQNGAIRYDSLQFESIPLGRAIQNVSLEEDTDQTLWAVCGDGFTWSLARKDSLKPIIQKSLAGKRTQLILATREGYLLAGTIGTGMQEWTQDQPKKIITYTPKNGLLSTVIWDIIQDREGNIWLATNDGLSKMPADYHAFGHYSSKSVEGAPNMLPEAGVNAVLVDYQWRNLSTNAIEKMVVAATSSGISFIKKDGNREIMTAKEGLFSDLALGLHQDERGQLWVLGRRGFTLISQNPNQSPPPGFSPPKAFQLWNSTMYVSTLLYTHINQGQTIWLPQSQQDAQLTATNWFVCSDRVLVLIKNKWYIFSKKSGLAVTDLRSMSVDNQNYTYLASSHKGLWKSQFPMSIAKIQSLTTQADPLTKQKEFGVVTTPSFSQQPIIVEKDTLKEVTGVLSLNSLLWVTSDHGILALEKETTTPLITFNQTNGLEKNSAAGIIPNLDTTLLWAASGHGLYGIDIATKKLVKKVKKKDGLVSNIAWGFPSIQMDEEGVLHFGTNKGLSLYQPEYDQADTLAPTVQFRNFQFNEITKGQNELLVEFSAPSYTHEAGIRYKTRLKGYEKDWSATTRETSIRYTNLPAVFVPKKYAFEILAGDEEGNWLETPTSYSFYVNPPWYLHWLAMFLYALISMGLIAGFTRWRTYNLQQRQKKLEKIVTERTAEVVAEKERSDELLLNILPAETAEELKRNGFAKAKNYDFVTIIFTDFKEFTKHSERLSPTELIGEIDHCFKAFDHIMGKYNVEKIKTVGDAYLAAAGLPSKNDSHALDAINAALAIRDFMLAYKLEREADGQQAFEMRIGVHTGPVVAGIVGIKKFAYDIWGDTVNIASRMESSGIIGQVNISQNTYDILKKEEDLSFVSRGKIEAKHKGEIEMYFVDRP